MGQIDARTAQMLQSVERNGVWVEKEVKGNSVTAIDMVIHN